MADVSSTVAPGAGEMQGALDRALKEVLACPACFSGLAVGDGDRSLECRSCRRSYPVEDGIPVLLESRGPARQLDELQFREGVAARHGSCGVDELLDVLSSYHCIPVMTREAERFSVRFSPDRWIVDLGIGYGWHWMSRKAGPRILGVDMSMGNLKIARRLLRDTHDVVLVCADAARLPIRQRCIAGIWSVQVLQHLPDLALRQAQEEMNRVLDDRFFLEMCNLNPAFLLRLAYRVAFRKLHRHGRAGEIELNRLSAREWLEIWRPFRPGSTDVSVAYSELFFHPDLRIRPSRYPLRLERYLAERAGRVAKLIARQVHVRVASRV